MSKLSRKNPIKEIAEELDALDIMLSALVEVLEEKGILTQEEWEARIKHKSVKVGNFLNFRSIQFKRGKKKQNSRNHK